MLWVDPGRVVGRYQMPRDSAPHAAHQVLAPNTLDYTNATQRIGWRRKGFHYMFHNPSSAQALEIRTRI